MEHQPHRGVSLLLPTRDGSCYLKNKLVSSAPRTSCCVFVSSHGNGKQCDASCLIMNYLTPTFIQPLCAPRMEAPGECPTVFILILKVCHQQHIFSSSVSSWWISCCKSCVTKMAFAIIPAPVCHVLLTFPGSLWAAVDPISSLCMPVTPGPGVGGLSQAAGFPAGAAVASVNLKKASSAEEPASCCSSESFVFDFLVNPKCASRFALF